MLKHTEETIKTISIIIHVYVNLAVFSHPKSLYKKYNRVYNIMLKYYVIHF